MLGKTVTRKFSYREIFLTFDVEDFINKESFCSLHRILSLLKKYDLRAIFFITGSVTEELRRFPKILDLLKAHEIGYHSTTHSVKPRIFEYTDVKEYEEAIEISLERETKRIDPISGETLGEGGILTLRKLFSKRVVCFRAPYLCWTPPHLEALRKLGFKFDFSTDICEVPKFYKGITFYPTPLWIDRISKFVYRNARITDGRVLKRRPRSLLFTILRKRINVLGLHPHLLNSDHWDYFYVGNNPEKACYTTPRGPIDIEIDFAMLELLFLQLNVLKRMEIVKITPRLVQPSIFLDPTRIPIERIYDTSLGYPKMKFNYEPRFLLSHFYHYFQGSP